LVCFLIEQELQDQKWFAGNFTPFGIRLNTEIR
jgi:hypothetical protein